MRSVLCAGSTVEEERMMGGFACILLNVYMLAILFVYVLNSLVLRSLAVVAGGDLGGVAYCGVVDFITNS